MEDSGRGVARMLTERKRRHTGSARGSTTMHKGGTADQPHEKEKRERERKRKKEKEKREREKRKERKKKEKESKRE